MVFEMESFKPKMNMDLKCEICEQRLSTNQIKKEHMNVVHGGVKKIGM